MHWLLFMNPAAAQQPLQDFLSAAETHAVDARVADADLGVARAARAEASGAWLPRVSANAGYTRNQVAVEATFPDDQGNLQTVTISAKDQLEASARVDVPLIDVPAWSRSAAAGATVNASEHRLDVAKRQVALQVTQAWFRLVAARNVAGAAKAAAETASSTSSWIDSRLQAGLADELELQRSLADRARSEEAVAEAQLEVALASRQLRVLTGLEPDDAVPELQDPLGEEPALERWLIRVDRVAEVRAAEADARSARAQRTAAGSALVPAVGAFASERWTNASGFGPQSLWSAGVQASWSLDVARPAAIAGANQAVIRASQQQTAVQEDVETQVIEAWHRVTSLTARVTATRAAEAASTRAAEVARAGFEAGTRSQLELSQAERDRFQAQVDRIRAEADLHVQRRALRMTVDLPPDLAAVP